MVSAAGKAPCNWQECYFHEGRQYINIIIIPMAPVALNLVQRDIN